MRKTVISDYMQFPIGPPIAGAACDPLSLGYIYVIGFSEPGIVKIGSSKSVASRIAELQCGNPFELFLKAAVSVYEGQLDLLEFAAHRLASPARIRGEWFELEPEEAVPIILKAARNKKYKVGSFLEAFNANTTSSVDHAAIDAERRRLMRIRMGIEDA